MKLRVLAVGHRMPAWVDAGFNEYARRMPPDAPLPAPDIELLTTWATSGAVNDKFPADLGGLKSSTDYCRVHYLGLPPLEP